MCMYSFCLNETEMGGWHHYFCRTHCGLATVWETKQLLAEQKLFHGPHGPTNPMARSPLECQPEGVVT